MIDRIDECIMAMGLEPKDEAQRRVYRSQIEAVVEERVREVKREIAEELEGLDLYLPSGMDEEMFNQAIEALKGG